MSARRRYRFDPEAPREDGTKGALVEVPPDYVGDGFSAGHTSEGELYDGARTLEGVDISSRKKRREYMRANGLTDPSDFKQHWPKVAEQRQRMQAGDFDHRARREAVGQAAYQVETRGRK